MTWFKVDDALPTHPKVRRIPRKARMAALGVWLACGAWSSHHLTDGAIDRDVVEDEGGRQVDAKALVDVGLWHQAEHECPRCPQPPRGSYQFHDWFDWQPSGDSVRQKREQEAQRKADYRAKKEAEREAARVQQNAARPANVPLGQAPDGQWDSGRTDAGSPALPTRPDPTRPDPKGPTDPSGSNPVTSLAESLVTRGNVRASDAVGVWSAAMKDTLGVTPSDDQCTRVGQISGDLLKTNDARRVLAGAILAGSAGELWIDRYMIQASKNERQPEIQQVAGQAMWDRPVAHG